MINRLLKVVEELTSIKKELEPHSGIDRNLVVFDAVAMAADQAQFAIGILQRRLVQELPLGTGKEPTQRDLIANEGAAWCDTCDNARSVCTCG